MCSEERKIKPQNKNIFACYKLKSHWINIKGCLVLFKNKSGTVMACMWTIRE